LQSWIFYAGATSMMVGNYLTTQGRALEDDLRMLRDLDLNVTPPMCTRT
jgi:biotin synthase